METGRHGRNRTGRKHLENSSSRKLIEYIKQKPQVYEASSSAFWDDENISGYMLEAHLDPDAEGATRKHEFIQRSADWIAERCGGGAGKKLLDLGCGPGLYAELFDDRGFQVTGLDFSRRSVQYAREHAAGTKRDIRYEYKNYLDMDEENAFDVVTLIYCDFGVLPPKDRRILLGKIKKALKQGGILILDGFTRALPFEELETVQYQDEGFWSAGPHVVIQRNYRYPETDNTLEQYLVITEEDCHCYNLWNQRYTRDTLKKEIESAGLCCTEFYDNVAGKAFTGRDTTICAVAEKQAEG